MWTDTQTSFFVTGCTNLRWLYLRGHYLRNRRQGGGCLRAVPYLKEATRLDPALAEAHAELAFCYGFDHLAETLRPEEGAALGRAEAERALALEARLPDTVAPRCHCAGVLGRVASRRASRTYQS